MSQDYYSIRTLNSKGFPEETRYYRNGSTKTLSAEQTAISDNPALIGHSLATGNTDAYFSKDDKNESDAYRFGRWLNKKLTPTEGNLLSKFLRKTGPIGGTGLGGAAGLGVGSLVDALTGSKRGKLWGALAGSVLGYITGDAAKRGDNYTYSDYWGQVRPNPDARVKQAGFYGDPKQQVLSALFAAPGLSSFDKTRAISKIQSMSSSQLAPLARMLHGVSGAAIGAIIMRFILGAGTGGTVLGALAGGLLGGFAPGPRVTTGLFS